MVLPTIMGAQHFGLAIRFALEKCQRTRDFVQNSTGAGSGAVRSSSKLASLMYNLWVALPKEGVFGNNHFSLRASTFDYLSFLIWPLLGSRNCGAHCRTRTIFESGSRGPAASPLE